MLTLATATAALALATLAGATSAALLTCAGKWGWLTWLQVNRGRYVPIWFPADCLFCLGAWLSALLLLAAAGALPAPAATLFAWLPAAAISRKLL